MTTAVSPKVLTNFATDNEEFQKSTKKAIDDVRVEAGKIVSGVLKFQKDMAAAKEILEGLVSADVLEWLMTEEYRSIETERDNLQQAINKSVRAEIKHEHHFLRTLDYHNWRDLPHSVLWLYVPC